MVIINVSLIHRSSVVSVFFLHSAPYTQG